MVKWLPGWLNALVLSPFYFALFAGYYTVLKWMLTWDDQMYFWILILCVFGACLYLAKWRFFPKDIEWDRRFN